MGRREEILDLEVVGDSGVRARVPQERARQVRSRIRILESRPGEEFTLERIPRGPSRLDGALETLIADPSRVRSIFREMFGRATLHEEGGGIHSGALARLDEVRLVVEDVGRHNVVDKLLGHALLEGWPPEHAVMTLSGRISGEMVVKAWRSGLPVAATISIPTSLARDVARRVGVTLLGRAVKDEPQIHRPR